MKKCAYYVLGFAIILVFLIIGRWLMSSHKWIQASNTPRSELPTRVINSSLSDSGSSTSATTTNNTITDIPNQQSIPAFAKERVEKTVAALNRANSRLLDMRGKVVDQYDQPVVGATIRGSILLYDGLERTKEDLRYTETDNQGLFGFEGIHGVTLGIWPQKEGYTYDLKLTSKRSGNYRGDYANPDVFVMWKLKGAEHVISDDKFYGIKPDGRVYTIDLIKGKKIEGASAVGDLLVQIQRPALIARGEKFNWSFSIQPIEGGLLETAAHYLNEAPLEGYQGRYAVSLSSSDANWTEKFQRTFFFTSRNRANYGWLKIEIIPNYNDTSVLKFESLLNPAGSRNLEVDPEKVTKAGK